ncbi:MAG: NAD-dependent epimerase/dehydratase family protein [Myxococcales bacterium]|nr:NAD-dependent epimerase/dehydratase family protein [Myxococcales bacterium]
MKTVAVFGAGGFVGSTLVEHLLAVGSWQVRPCIHSSGGAWRLAPHGIELHTVDVTDRAQVQGILRDCSHVVNASRGERDVMLEGLQILLEESRAAGIERFVHLSSVSAYGVRAPGSLLRSADPPAEELTGYGRTKLEQDQMVESAQDKGLACVALAPPYISGAYSGFLLQVMQAMHDGTLALIDGGALPCSLIDVQNLAIALESALVCERADGRRLLVTDDDTRTWGDLVGALRALSDDPPAPPTLSRDEATRLTAQVEPRASFGASLRTLGSILTGPATRRALADDPLIGRAYALASGAVPESLKRRIPGRRPAANPAARASATTAFDRHLLEVQLRAIRHDCKDAREQLGYRPALDFDGSMRAFASWYRATHGFGTDSWAALRQL